MTTPEPTPFGLRSLHEAARHSGGFWQALVSLIFLPLAIVPVWLQGDPIRSAIVTVLVLLLGLLFAYATGLYAFARRVAYGWLALLWLTVAGLASQIGTDVAFLSSYIILTHTFALPWRAARWVVPALTAGAVTVAVVSEQLFALLLSLSGGAIAWSLGAGIERRYLEERARVAEEKVTLLAVAAERERIGRDLHDILGHSLTTITVSAQLAQRLIDADPEAARAQVAEIERISRQSLADVRSTASGMQVVRVASEIASARSVLAAAGIDADVPTAVPALPDDRAELFGYVVREAITNVVRHSRATRCTITVAETSVRVADDGRGGVPGTGRTGLAGLERRVRAGGGRLTVASGAGGTVVTVTTGGVDPDDVGTTEEERTR